MTRVTTISRPVSVPALATAAIFMLLLELLHVLVEAIEALVPELLEADDPIVDRLEAPGVEPVEALLAGLSHAHQSHLAQHPQVLRRARLGDAERSRQLVDRALAALEQSEDPPALRLGDRIEHI